MIQFDIPNITLAIFVPLDKDGNFLSGDALHQHILDFVPVDTFSRYIDVQKGIQNAEAMHSLVGQSFEFDEAEVYHREMPVFAVNTSAAPHTRDSDLVYIEMLVEDILKKKGLA